MPTYDYKCNACGHEFELFQSMSDKVKRKCPECGKNALERLIGTGAAVLFKGSGFYETDYRSKSYKDAAKSDKEAASAKTDSSGEKTSTKAEKPEKGKKATESKPKADSGSKPKTSKSTD